LGAAPRNPKAAAEAYEAASADSRFLSLSQIASSADTVCRR
jgi:hypothetical protein